LSAVHAITFDNLGEVTELARGEFPAGEPLGRHPSVTRALPRILEVLAETGLRATFFVEGRNTELYPDALVEIAAAGHEVAYHGWCHEQWAGLEAAEEADVLARGVRAFAELGLRLDGFRPPGGELNPDSLRLLAEHGFTYCSPAAEAEGPVAVLPFEWPLVDAYHYLPRFAELRGSEAPGTPGDFAARLRESLGRSATVIFHPFLLDSEERFAVLRAHLEAVRRGGLQCAPLREIAVSSAP
jgi:peptidoglycan/xylan/chitin deacetylase (PgdA/CDA1 family)